MSCFISISESPSGDKKITIKSITVSDMIKQMNAEKKAGRRSSASPAATSASGTPHVSTPMPRSRVQPRLGGGPDVDVIFDFDSPLTTKPLMPRIDPDLAKVCWPFNISLRSAC